MEKITRDLRENYARFTRKICDERLAFDGKLVVFSLLVPAYTYTASASVVAHVGAKVVLVDVQRPKDVPGDYCLQMDYDKLAEARLMTSRTSR